MPGSGESQNQLRNKKIRTLKTFVTPGMTILCVSCYISQFPMWRDIKDDSLMTFDQSQDGMDNPSMITVRRITLMSYLEIPPLSYFK